MRLAGEREAALEMSSISVGLVSMCDRPGTHRGVGFGLEQWGGAASRPVGGPIRPTHVSARGGAYLGRLGVVRLAIRGFSGVDRRSVRSGSGVKLGRSIRHGGSSWGRRGVDPGRLGVDPPDSLADRVSIWA